MPRSAIHSQLRSGLSHRSPLQSNYTKRSNNSSPSQSHTSSPASSHAVPTASSQQRRQAQTHNSSAESKLATDSKNEDTGITADAQTHTAEAHTMSPNNKKRVPPSSGSHMRTLRHPSRRKDMVRTERKASVRKQTYDLDEEEGDEEAAVADADGADEEDSDLSDVPDVAAQLTDDEDEKANGGNDLDNSESDTEMAARLMAAGEGESLLGSGESDDEQEGGEEQYIIADASRRDWQRSHGGPEGQKSAGKPNMHRNKPARRLRASHQDNGAEGDVEDVGEDGADEADVGDMDPFSPHTMEVLGMPVLDDELFNEQAGFHSDSEPSFTDFFASDGEGLLMQDDDDELTSMDSSDDGEDGDDDVEDDDDDVSDVDGALVGEPFLAHLGGVNATPQDHEQLHAAMEAGAQIARQDIPLLVIEDLDGRLIYARAGDGEAVFGSDGEFEFVNDSDEDSDSETEFGDGVDARDPRWSTPGWTRGGQITSASGAGGEDDGGEVFQDDDDDEGETTDELPDEDMPFPRLLVGSVDPRGGRTSRRARALAARMRKLSPNAQASSSSNAAPQGTASQAMEGSGSGSGSGSSTSITTPTEGVATASTTDAQRMPPPNTPSAAKDNGNGISLNTAPEMGSFMPSSSKSVHRAVIDGSRQAASPFTSKVSLQRKGLAGKRRPRPSSVSAMSQSGGAMKRLRRDSSVRLDETSESPSSPETAKADALPMDLDDVVDGSMLWRSGSSSDSDQASDVESEATAGPSSGRQRSRAITTDGSGFGLNVNAFSRWRRIPMGAFRDRQLRARGPETAGAHEGSSGTRGGNGQRQPTMMGNYLLQRVSGSNGSGSNRREAHSPFRRAESQRDSLHMVVPSPHSSSDRRQESFLISPVLWPVRGGARNQGGSSATQDATPNGAPPTLSLAEAGDHRQGAKMTKREKRERKARRAAQRKAARADKEQLLQPLVDSQGDAENKDAIVAGGTKQSNGSMDTAAAAPKTPTLGISTVAAGSHVPVAPDTLSPATAMPKLSITEASPRASPAPLGSVLQGGGATADNGSADQSVQAAVAPQAASGSGLPKGSALVTARAPVADSSSSALTSNTHGHPPASSSLPGNTPPTRAAMVSSSVPSLPSSIFGAPVASPLFGGLFAPLNMNAQDEGELDDEGSQREGGAAMLRI
ncbi:unnamed protein product [Jaminaea pallidilutea]